MWVSPFRNPWIKGYLLLPMAFRSLSRLSSALSAKASTLRSYQLNQSYLQRQILRFRFFFSRIFMLVFTLLIRVSLKKLSLTPRMSFLLAMNLHPQASIHCFDIRFCIRFSRYFIPHKPYPTHQEESIIQPEHSKPSVSRSRIVFNYPSRPV